MKVRPRMAVTMTSIIKLGTICRKRPKRLGSTFRPSSTWTGLL
jgi:hypothetical protein